MARELYVDGNTEGRHFQSCDKADGLQPPFAVFDADQQANIAGPFHTWDEAEAHRLEILAGAEPKLDGEKMGAWLEHVDELDDGAWPEADPLAWSRTWDSKESVT